MTTVSSPKELITVDYYGPLSGSIGGIQYIFFLFDLFSKLVKLYTLKKQTLKQFILKLTAYFPKYSRPSGVLSDNGTQFTSPEWGIKLGKLGVKAFYSSVRHPQSNLTERGMREQGRLFRTMCSEKHTKWATLIPEIEVILNYTTYSSTGYFHLGNWKFRYFSGAF